jgi:peroxiredoxin
MSLIVLSSILLWLIVGVGCWLGYQLVRQHGRILLRLEALEEQLAQLTSAGAPRPPTGLAVGSVAPTFDLPDLDGRRVALAQLRGQRILLLFFNPSCGFCLQMAPDLAALPTDDRDGQLLPIVVTTGDPEVNRQLVQQYAIRCPVLLQQQMEVATLYQVDGTPMGYLIDEQGHIASEIAVGAAAVLSLATAAPATSLGSSAEAGHMAATNGTTYTAHQGNRSLAESHINRTGLAAGTPAPRFCLPQLDGRKLVLEDYRGRCVFLVFSDPHCGPCDLLAPELEQWHRSTADLHILMVSRGAPEANRAKVAQHGLTFPVVLQRQWEISRTYGMFATPIAYLIDEDGIIAADVAVGVDPIRTLFANALARVSMKGGMPMQ